jgi:DNA-binding MarR family transcriptional regulator
MPVERRRARTVGKETDVNQAAFRFALREFLRFSEMTARRVGLTPQQYQALLAIRGFPGRDRMSIGELAERLQLHHHSTVGLVDRLVSKRLAVREKSTMDRRRVLVRLTPRGIRLVARVSAANRGELRRLRPRLTQLLARLT